MTGRVARTMQGLAALLVIAVSGCSAPVTFTNPIKDIGNDPYVVQKDGYYYLVESWDAGIWVTKSSRDNLTDLAWAGERVKVWSYPAGNPNCTDVWAPELHPVGDRWYIYYAATTCDKVNANHRMYVLESETDDALGAYADRGKVTDETDMWAIDGTRFEWRGRQYFAWSGWPGEVDGRQNLYLAEMSDPVTVVGARVLIAEPEHPWELRTQPTVEGPQAIVTDDAVYLVYSASASWTNDYCYGMLTATADNLLDPANWDKSPDPVFESTDEVWGPGHGSFVASPDGTESWMVYHSARFPGSGWDRVMNAQRFTWKDGVPDFAAPVPPTAEQVVPSGQLRPGD